MNVRCTWEVVLSSLGMADVGTCYTVDAQRHVRSFTMFARYGKSRRPQHYRCPEACGGPHRMGVNSFHNTVGENVGTYNTIWALLYQEGCRVLFLQVYRVWSWYCSLTCVPCLTFSVHFLVLTERVSPVGWSQSALIAPVGEE